MEPLATKVLKMASMGRPQASMSTVLTAPQVIERLLAALDQAEWRYDPEIDEMEVLLPGWKGRGGEAILIGEDVYVRLDIETHAPLSIIIPAYRYWLGSQPPPSVDPQSPVDLQAWLNLPRQTAVEALKRTIRKRAQDLSGALEP